MPRRQAACEPCREAKLGCDHDRPVCGRCALAEKATSCIYRAAPFRRATRLGSSRTIVEQNGGDGLRIQSNNDGVESIDQQDRLRSVDEAAKSAGRSHYPNAGHLGSSSHAAIFDRILGESGNLLSPIPAEAVGSSPRHCSRHYSSSSDVDAVAMEMADRLRNLVDCAGISDLIGLVEFWLASGTTLALAEPLVTACVNTVKYLRQSAPRDGLDDWSATVSHCLLQNTKSPLKYTGETAFVDFAGLFSNGRARLETLGIFICAVVRATVDVTFFPLTYKTDAQRRELQRLGTRLGDCVLELCLLLDNLDDLQLILQYENFIVHSHIDGDASTSNGRATAFSC